MYFLLPLNQLRLIFLNIDMIAIHNNKIIPIKINRNPIGTKKNGSIKVPSGANLVPTIALIHIHSIPKINGVEANKYLNFIIYSPCIFDFKGEGFSKRV